MADINDFKILKKKCKRHFQLASSNLSLSKDILNSLSEIEQERFGFYYFIIQQTSNLVEYDEITNTICDSDFNKKIFGINYKDEGIDAIIISEENNTISLYNFKYREKFNLDSKQRENEAIISSKFLNAIKNNNIKHLEGKIKENASIIIDNLDSLEEWQIIFYAVSNDYWTLNIEDENLINFKELYGCTINTIGLKDITNIMSIKPSNINATLVISKENILSHSEDTLSSNKSYIATISLSELLRITCNNNELRNHYNIEDENQLSDVDIDYNVLFDNVRGFIVKSKFNINIEKTLREDPSKFFFYNNGITIVADNIDSTQINTGRKQKLEICNLQVLNGGQTLRTIHNFNKKDKSNISKKLSKAYILVKILEITEDNIKNRIGEFTNSQNAVDFINLRSIREEQIKLEQYLKDSDILYVRKKGNTGLENTTYSKSIGLERFGQILLATKIGKPEETSNKKRLIFNDYYDDLFTNNEQLLSEKTILLINKYFEILNIYKKSKYLMSEQKIMYIIFCSELLKNNDYENLINKFETYMDNYKKINKLEVSLSRLLIRITFRESLTTYFKEQN